MSVSYTSLISLQNAPFIVFYIQVTLY